MGSILHLEREVRSVPAGEYIFKQGDPGDYMYSVIEGEIEILINEVVVESVGVDGILGEMALIDSQARSASARAKTNSIVAPINQKRFQFMVQQTPFFAIQVMHVMAERLRRWHASTKP